jgi:Golgi SNAP receptor complex protein 2
MQRTIDDYDSMAKREMIKVKQEKARLYVDFIGGPQHLY